jgi:drug/metabolite transporter (DMT)-like permease
MNPVLALLMFCCAWFCLSNAVIRRMSAFDRVVLGFVAVIFVLLGYFLERHQ